MLKKMIVPPMALRVVVFSIVASVAVARFTAPHVSQEIVLPISLSSSPGSVITFGTFKTDDLDVVNTQNIGGQFTSTSPGVFDPDFNELSALRLNGEQTMLLNSTGSDGNDVQLFMRYEATNRVGETININNFLDGTFDTTNSGIQAIGVQSIVQGNKSAGSGSLNNIAFAAAVGNGDNNYTFFGQNGTMRNDGPAAFFDTQVQALIAATTVDFFGTSDVKLGVNVEPFNIPGSPTVIPQINLGVASIDGTQIRTKNTTASSITGIESAGDTSISAAIEPGFFLFRGAGGGIGGSTEAVFVLDAGDRALVGAQANDLIVANETANKRVLFSADGTGFTIGASLDKNGNLGCAGQLVHSGGIGSGAPAGQVITGGSGAPAINCNNGDLYTRTDGSVSTTLYVCTAANTWTAK